MARVWPVGRTEREREGAGEQVSEGQVGEGGERGDLGGPFDHQGARRSERVRRGRATALGRYRRRSYRRKEMTFLQKPPSFSIFLL